MKTIYRNVLVPAIAVVASVSWVFFCITLMEMSLDTILPISGRDDLVNVTVAAVPILLIFLIVNAHRRSLASKDEFLALNYEIVHLRKQLESKIANGVQTGAAEIFDPQSSGTNGNSANNVPLATVIRALSFAEGENDTEGIKAIEYAMGDPDLKELLNAASHILHRLSKEEIIVDELEKRLATPEVWRRLASNSGETEAIPLGTVGGTKETSVVAALYESDSEFRELSRKLFSKLELVVREFLTTASDNEIDGFANSRTVVASVLLSNAINARPG